VSVHSNTQTQALATTHREALAEAPAAVENSALVNPTKESPSRKYANNFKRVMVRRPGAERYTTVCVSAADYAYALQFAHGSAALVNASLRAAALDAKTQVPTDFSAVVRKLALSKLYGSYRPVTPKVQAAPTVEEARWAAENNSAWEQPGGRQ
jgi:hypothetical protein